MPEVIVSPFNRDMYISILSPEVEYNIDGNVVSTTPRTEPVQIINFAGWDERDLNVYGQG